MRSPLHDEQEFSKFFHQYYGHLVLYSYRTTDNQAASEDIVEEAFISLWTKRNELGEIRSPKAYIYRAVRNRSLSWRRDQQVRLRHQNAAVSMQEAVEKTRLDEQIYAEMIEQMIKAIERLPPQCRKVFRMHFIDGKKLPEIARELNIALGTVKNHRIKGLSMMRDALISPITGEIMIASFIVELLTNR